MTTKIIRPQKRQAVALASSADILIYGGAAGGGKTWTLLMEFLRHIYNGLYRGVIFRRTYPQIRQEGGLWDESNKLYGAVAGSEGFVGRMSWLFQSGAMIRFAHLFNDKSLDDYQGAQIPVIGFDELTHFTERMFFYMMSRNRSMSGIVPYIRATCNPDPDSWVATFLEWWIDQETGFARYDRAGVVRWFVRYQGELVWGDSKEELIKRFKGVEVMPKSVTFVPAKVTDNPALLKVNPDYIANLMALPPVDRARLLEGNWKIRPDSGNVFNRGWFKPVDVIPNGGREILFWDFAATEKKQQGRKGNDPDYTAAVAVRYVNGIYYVGYCYDEQLAPIETEEQFVNLSRQRAWKCRQEGTQFAVRFEKEPGSAGQRDALRMIRLIPELDVKAVVPQGDKMLRAKPFASQAEGGNVRILKDGWTERWLSHMHNQPTTPHDDIMDASSGAYNSLVLTATMPNGGKAPQSVSMRNLS